MLTKSIVKDCSFCDNAALSNNIVIFKLFDHMPKIFISSAYGKPSKYDGIWTSHPNSSVKPLQNTAKTLKISHYIIKRL